MSGQLKKRLIVAAAIAVVATTGIVLAVMLGGGTSSRSSHGDTVRIELRAPGGKLRMKGRDLGRAPITVQLPRSSEPIEVEAEFIAHLVHRQTKQPATDIKKQTKLVIPDQDQTVDFNIRDAKSVGEITPRVD